MRLDLEKLRLPASFESGREFFRTDPWKEGKRRYRFMTLEWIHFSIPLKVRGRISFRDKHHREWVAMDRRGFSIAPRYAWNGCSPKRYLPILGWVGTPDFEATIPGSLAHDALYQFSHCDDFPLHRRDCDAIFRRIIELGGAPRLARLYAGAVCRFGSWDGNPSEEGEYSVLLP